MAKTLNRGGLIRAKGIMETGADYGSRTVYLVGEIDDAISFRFMAGFRVMDETPGGIKVIMNSVGGSETAGYAIYDTIRLSRNKVTIEAYGACQSIAAAIMQSGDERAMAPEASFMIHNGSINLGGQSIEQDTVLKMAESVNNGNKKYYRILASKSNLPVDKIAKLCEQETFCCSQQTVIYGLADRVIGGTRWTKGRKPQKRAGKPTRRTRR